MTFALQLYTFITVAAGAIFFVAGTLGLLRFPDPLSKLHALTKADNLGLGLIVLGLLPLMPDWQSALKLIVIWLLTMLGSAAASQLIARVANNGAATE